MHDELRDEEISQFVREGLSRAVAQEHERITRIEDRVMRRLAERRGRRSFARLSMPGLKPAWAFAAAATLFVLGFFVGNWTADPFKDKGVEFVVFHPTAQQVTLSISYPVAGRIEWEDIPMKKRSGLWYISLPLPPGTYEYGFKIDGQWWAYDEAADYYVRSTNNTVNAVREIGVPSGDRT